MPFAQPAAPKRRGWIAWALFALLVVLVLLSLSAPRTLHEPLALSSFYELLAQDAVVSVTIEGDDLTGQLKPNPLTQITAFRTALPDGTTADWAFTHWLLTNRGSAVVDASSTRNLFIQVLLPLVPWLLIFGLLWFFVLRNLTTARRGPLPVVVVHPAPDAPEAAVR